MNDGHPEDNLTDPPRRPEEPHAGRLEESPFSDLPETPPVEATPPWRESASPGVDVPETGLDAVELTIAESALEEPAADKKPERSGIVESLVLVLIALVLALTLKTYVAEAYEIKGRSMRPTFHNGERVVVLKSFYTIRRGDIIVFASSEDPTKDLIKRVVGLPGETVRIAKGQVYINGKKIEEGYAIHNRQEMRRAPKSERIPPGQYYVLGDNRPDSHDSRFFHGISEDSLKGKVIVRWWPLSDFSAF